MARLAAAVQALSSCLRHKFVTPQHGRVLGVHARLFFGHAQLLFGSAVTAEPVADFRGCCAGAANRDAPSVQRHCDVLRAQHVQDTDRCAAAEELRWLCWLLTRPSKCAKMRTAAQSCCEKTWSVPTRFVSRSKRRAFLRASLAGTHLEAIRQDGRGDHFVFWYLRLQLVVRGLQEEWSPCADAEVHPAAFNSCGTADMRYAMLGGGRTWSKRTMLLALSFILPLDHFCRHAGSVREL